MQGAQRGRLVLEAAPDKKIEKDVVAYLAKLIRHATPEALTALTAKVRTAPLVLSKDVSADQGREIAAALGRLGAKAVFVPHSSLVPESEQDAVPVAAPASRDAVRSVRPGVGLSAPGRPARVRSHRGLRLALALLLLACSLGLLTWRLYPYLEYRSRGRKAEVGQAHGVQSAVGNPTHTTPPAVMRVPPAEIHETFLTQYRVLPDTRFLKAFTVLAERFREYGGTEASGSSFGVGRVSTEGDTVIVSLLRDGRSVAEVKMVNPVTFSGAMSALDQWLTAMEGIGGKVRVRGAGEPSRETVESAEAEIDMVDPRAIVSGLMKLEELWHKQGPDPKVLRAAVRGYAMLPLALAPDRMDYSDQFAAHGLAFLALAKHMNASLPLAAEEALLALNMGYTAHAAALLQGLPGKSVDVTTEMIIAYMRQDLPALRAQQGPDARILGYYLLARLYREMGLYEEAEVVATELLNRLPGLYPPVVEIIHSGDLGAAKVLTAVYPLHILSYVQGKVIRESWEKEQTWGGRLKALAATLNFEFVPLGRFESLLDRWHPMAGVGKGGFLIDEARIRNMFRALYSGALWLRFNLLIDRWAVLDQAEAFVEELARADREHPLVASMLARVYAERGRRREADQLCAKVIGHPQASGRLATAAFFLVDDQLARLGLAAAVAQKVDGRPEYLFHMGSIFQKLWNYDLAERFYTLGLERNPHRYSAYSSLTAVSGSATALQAALKSNPHSVELQEQAGDHFAKEKDPAAKEEALRCYSLALEQVPTNKSLPLKKAKVLRQLHRYEEAIAVYQQWLEDYGKSDLSTVQCKGSMARTYLEMGKAPQALEIVADQVDSYQAGVMMVAARAYEEVGQLRDAEDLYRRAVDRYPTVDHVLAGSAAFYWRQDRHKEAAALISQGRKSAGGFSSWYFDDFLEAFADSPAERVLTAVDFLVKAGATSWEVSSLAFRLLWKARPDLAYQVMQKAPAGGDMEELEKQVNLYKVLKGWKGKEAALQYLHGAVPPRLRFPLTMVLYKQGMFEVILQELRDPGTYLAKYREFLWLQRLAAWLASGKKQTEMEEEFRRHYGSQGSSDSYQAIGCYLFGTMSRRQLLDLIKTPQQRCEFAYYIGLSERLQGNFPEAATWYHICRETTLQRNGEFHWASTEMFWWAHMGTRNRHLLVADDIKAYGEKTETQVENERKER
jgi:tetratricopeptide (TPR) repeat protein